jgi:hypothetical protein
MRRRRRKMKKRRRRKMKKRRRRRCTMSCKGRTCVVCSDINNVCLSILMWAEVDHDTHAHVCDSVHVEFT